MDPNAALRDILDHILEGDYDEARESLSNLDGWLNRGGFLPTFPGKDFPLTPGNWQGVRFVIVHILGSGQD